MINKLLTKLFVGDYKILNTQFSELFKILYLISLAFLFNANYLIFAIFVLAIVPFKIWDSKGPKVFTSVPRPARILFPLIALIGYFSILSLPIGIIIAGSLFLITAFISFVYFPYIKVPAWEDMDDSQKIQYIDGVETGYIAPKTKITLEQYEEYNKLTNK